MTALDLLGDLDLGTIGWCAFAAAAVVVLAVAVRAAAHVEDDLGMLADYERALDPDGREP